VIRRFAFSAAVAVLTCAPVISAGAQQRPWTPLPSPVSRTCPDGLCQSEALAPLFRALDGRWGGVVRIVQFGDSHTAGRLITSALETRLRARFPARDIRVKPIGVSGVTLANLVEQRLPVGEPAPDLIIIAYGDNEGFDDALDAGAYERLLVGQITRFRGEAPTAAILILGAPDAMRGEGGGTCPGDTERRWRAPVNLAVVRDLQFRTAARLGVAFWDWQGRMGGDCSADRLTLAGVAGEEPMMRGDHVHFTQAGADWIGGLLYNDLMTAGRAWYTRNPQPGGR
jgi:lysophospholipase L1-like esterase